MNLIETKGLQKRFFTRKAVRNFDLTLSEGGICALLGPNGAGKTTIFKMLAGILRPTSGTASMLGVPVRKLKAEHWQRIGYVSEDRKLYEWMTLDQLTRFISRFYTNWDDGFEAELREIMNLDGKQKIATMSKGQKIKVHLLTSLCFRPEILLPDEPFSGLDQIVKNELIDSLLETTQRHNWLLLLASHDLSEIENLADRVIFLNEGRVTVNEEMTTLLDRVCQVHVRLESPLSQPFEEPHTVQVKQTDRSLSFIHTNLDGNARAALEQRFTGDVVDINTLSLKEIFVAIARD